MAGLIERLRAAAGVTKKLSDPLAAIAAEMAGVTATLEQIRVERAAIEVQLAEAQTRREALLQGGAERAEIVAHDSRVAELVDNKTTCDLLERAQQRRLPDLQAQHAGLLLDRGRARFQSSAAGLLAAMQETAERFAQHLRVVAEIRDQVGDGALGYFPPPPAMSESCLIVGPEQIARWAADVARAAPNFHEPAAAPVAAPKPWPWPRGYPQDIQHILAQRERATAVAPPAPAERSTRPRRKPATPPSVMQEGFVSAVVLRGGYEDPEGATRSVGETIWLPPEIADQAAQSGAVEYVRSAA